MDSSTTDQTYASRRYDCPQCGAPVEFRSSISLSSVCGHCRSIVVRQDFQVATFGHVAELPPDLSPLQIGTQGHWQGRAFTLIGRMRLHYGDGSWTEWCADFGQGTYGWVAEVMGFYMVSFAHSVKLPLVQEDVPAGQIVKIDGDEWRVADVKEGRCIAAEGELPMVAPPGWSRTSIDLVGPGGEFGSIEITPDSREFFSGEYAEFGALNFTGLRKIPGWDKDAEITRRQSQAMPCPSCGAPVNLRAEGQSMAAVCGSCASILDTTTPNLQEIGKVAQTTLRLKLLLPIGTRGLFKDEMWEVVGFMRRKDRWCSWDEYLLFNPWLGFRFLVTFGGHWSFVRILPGHHTGNRWQGQIFKLFAREESVTTDVLGEFYWRVRNGERALLTDYVSPPYILSKEEMPGLNEITWSAGEYVEPEEVQKAFVPAGSTLPRPSGTYLNQPNPHGRRWKEVRATFIFTLIAYILIQVLFMGWGTPRHIAHTGIDYQGTRPGETLVSEPFKLDGSSAPLHITATGLLLTDTYLGLKGSLVESKTQRSFPVAFPLANYTTAPDGSRQKITLPAIPSGEYVLRLTPDAAATLPNASVTFTIERGGLFWSNFWLGLFIICLWPVWNMMRSGSFEKRRWYESEFNPYGSSDD
ncbi:DUF4178 domain-containing protein [Prosthecobacter algae]|uniref:DUF4178 domain-containing protein n=1 Tax=Prosthecobacter algae TaxID=1144682 RepID=A0ABP9PQW9_9BACT